MTLVILLIVLACLSLLAYVTKRRFGVLGLALCAGLVLSQQLTGDVSNVLKAGDVPVEPLGYASAASALLILLPALTLLLAGPKYHDARMRLVGALGFGAFATMLLLGPLTTDLPTLDTSVKPALDMVAANKTWIITIAVILAVLDTFALHSKALGGKKSGH